jgi:hypothetical protein
MASGAAGSSDSQLSIAWRRCALEAPDVGGGRSVLCSLSPRIPRKDLISAPRAQRRSGEHRSRAQPRAAAGEHGAHGEEQTLTVASTERCYCF